MKTGQLKMNNSLTSIDDVKIVNLREVLEEEGRLIPAELAQVFPNFEVKRVFFVDNVRDREVRGLHSHYETEQIIFCIKGKLKVICKDGKNTFETVLDRPNLCVYIPKMIWDEQIYLTKDTIMLSIANTSYDPKDYINCFEEFIEKKYATKD